MDWHRTKIVILYSYYHFRHSMETWFDIIWFPLIKVITFGFLAFVLSKSELGIGYTQSLITGLIYWEMMRLVQYSVAVGVLWDVWSDSLTSLFITPLKMSEFLFGQYLSGLIKAILMSAVMVLFSWILFGYNPLTIGLMVVLYFIILAIFGGALSLFITSLIIRFGTNVQSMAWGLIYLLQPFSAIFYPVEALPQFIRWVAYGLPISYVMESVRAQHLGYPPRMNDLLSALIMAIIYLILSFVWFRKIYLDAKKSGSFARLEM